MIRPQRRAAAPKPPPEDIVEIFDCEQRSEEWYDLRMGLVTASVLSAIMATSDDQKMRTRLLHRLAAEKITGKPMETFSNDAMARGITMEPEALEHYAFTRGVELERVGFIRRTIKKLDSNLVVGCSPDGMITSQKRIVQIKTMQPDLLVALVDGGRFPSEHRWQCHGELWVSGFEECDLMIYWPGFPNPPSWTIERDEATCRQIENEVEKFNWELRELVKRIEARRGR